MDDVFTALHGNQEKQVDIKLSENLDKLINAFIDKSNTNLSKREHKALSILWQNRFIREIIIDYPVNKRYINAEFKKDLKEINKDICNAIGISNVQENESRIGNFFNRFSRK